MGVIHIRYLGGKSRIKRDIAAYINENADHTKPFVSLFCGSCAVESLCDFDKKTLNDAHPHLISMWRDLQRGRDFPSVITSDEYLKIKARQNEDMGLAGFVGFGCSYGGKWWGGIAREHRGDDFCETPKESLLRDFSGVKNAQFICGDYGDVEIPEGAVVYCDPPYANTTRYSTGDFNIEEYWEYMRELSKRADVYISEEVAPDDFVCVWKKPLRRQLDNQGGNTFIRTEKLFKYKG